jgi:hypothetical protein
MIKTLGDIVGKTYAARGAFTEITTENCVPNGALKFEATNNRRHCTIEGLLINFNKDKDEIREDYKVELTKITSDGHTIDLSKARQKLKAQVKNQESYNITLEQHKVLETYSGITVSNIPIIKSLNIVQKYDEQKFSDTGFDIQALRDALLIGFKNLLYDKHKGKIIVVRPNIEEYHHQTHGRKSVVIDIVDGEFVTERLPEVEDESLITREYIPIGLSTKTAHVRAGHIRHYEQDNGSVIRVAVAPYVVKPFDISEVQKQKYYLGPKGEISQETMSMTEKRGTLEDPHIKRIIDTYEIPTYKELNQ